MIKVYLKNPLGYAIIGTGKPAQALPKNFEFNEPTTNRDLRKGKNDNSRL